MKTKLRRSDKRILSALKKGQKKIFIDTRHGREFQLGEKVILARKELVITWAEFKKWEKRPSAKDVKYIDKMLKKGNKVVASDNDTTGVYDMDDWYIVHEEIDEPTDDPPAQKIAVQLFFEHEKSQGRYVEGFRWFSVEKFRKSSETNFHFTGPYPLAYYSYGDFEMYFCAEDY